MSERLIKYWVYGGALAGVLLLLLAPLLLAGWSLVMVATFLHLPAYMLHQLEEHDGDRFRRFFNEMIGRGRDVLSPLAVFVTNVPGVWGVLALSLYGAAVFDRGWAFVAVDLVMVNAFVHVAHAIIFRRYNPGLITALVFFLPLGGATYWLLLRSGADGIFYQVTGLLVAVAIHAVILLHVRRRAAVRDR